MGAEDPRGYGVIFWGKNAAGKGMMNKAHRMSWVAFKGPIPERMQVNHKCDVRACVNPDHLWLGTQKDNMDDMVRKGRQIWTGRPRRSQ